MKEEKMMCPGLTVDKMVSILANAYSKAVNEGTSIRKVPTVMLWGPPGVGKSQGVQQVAKRVEKATGKKVIVTDVRLILFNPVDLRGIPTFDVSRTFSVWLKPKILDMDESEDVINFLFLDEISAAPPSVQAAAYQIALDRRVGEHRLPENCAVLAAGNRMSDKSVAYKMPRALANRMMHFEILPDFESWGKWASQNGIDPRIRAFLDFRRECFFDKGESDAFAFPSPRTWEMVSDVLRYCEPDVKKAGPMIKGLVGVGAGQEFLSWCAHRGNLPDVGKIFDGTERVYPKSSDELYAVVGAISDYARDHKDDVEGLANSIRYARKLPRDYSFLIFKAYGEMFDDERKKLIAIPGFREWFNEVGDYVGSAD